MNNIKMNIEVVERELNMEFKHSPSINLNFNNTQWISWPAWKSTYEIYIANWWTMSEIEWLNTAQANVTALWDVNRDFSIDFENIFLS